MRILSIIQPSEMGSDFRFEDDVWKVNFPAGLGEGGGVPLSTDANNAIGLGSDDGAFISTDLLGAYALTQDNGSKKINLYRFPQGTEFNPETATLVSSVNLIELSGVFDDVAIDGALITFTDADTGLTLTIDTDNLQKVSDIVGSDTVLVVSEAGVTTLSVKVDPNPNNAIKVTEDGLFADATLLQAGDVDLHQTFAEVEAGLCHAVGNSHLVIPSVKLTDVAGNSIGYITDIVGLPVSSTTEGDDHCPQWEAPTVSNCRVGKVGIAFMRDMPYSLDYVDSEVTNYVDWRIFLNGVDTGYIASGIPQQISPPAEVISLTQGDFGDGSNFVGKGYLDEIISDATGGLVLGGFKNTLVLQNISTEQIILTLVPSVPVTLDQIAATNNGGFAILGLTTEQATSMMVGGELSEMPENELLEDYFDDVKGVFAICLAPSTGGGTGSQISCSGATDRFTTSGLGRNWTLKIDGTTVVTNGDTSVVIAALEERNIRVSYNGELETNYRNLSNKNIRIELIAGDSGNEWDKSLLEIDQSSNPTLMGYDPYTMEPSRMAYRMLDGGPLQYQRITVCLAPANEYMQWDFKQTTSTTATVTLFNSVKLISPSQTNNLTPDSTVKVETSTDKWGDYTWNVSTSEPIRLDITFGITAGDYVDEYKADFFARRPMVVTLANTHEYARAVKVNTTLVGNDVTVASVEVVGVNGSTVVTDPQDGTVINAVVGAIRLDNVAAGEISYIIQGRYRNGSKTDKAKIKFVTGEGVEEIVEVILDAVDGASFQPVSPNSLYSQVEIGVFDSSDYMDVNDLTEIVVETSEGEINTLDRVNGVGGSLIVGFDFSKADEYKLYIKAAFIHSEQLAILGSAVVGVDDWGEIEAGGYTFNRETYESKFGNNDIDFTSISKNNLSYVPKKGPTNLQNLTGMFAGTDLSDPTVDISEYQIGSVHSMVGVFAHSNFNGDISRWATRYVGVMDYAFYGSKYSKDLSLWCVSNIRQEPPMFSHRSLLKAANKPVWGTCPLEGNNNSSEWGSIELSNPSYTYTYNQYGLADDFIAQTPEYTVDGKLRTVDIRSPMRFLGKRSLKDQEITTLRMLDGMLVIDEQALMNNKLATVAIPSTVKTIGKEAFVGNPMTSIVMASAIPPSLGVDALPETVTEIVMSDEAIPVYSKHKDWKQYVEKLKPFSEVVGVLYKERNGKTGFIAGPEVPEDALQNTQSTIVSISEGVTTVGAQGLFGTQANYLKIPNSLTTVGNAGLNLDADILEFSEGFTSNEFIKLSRPRAAVLILPSTTTELVSIVTRNRPDTICCKAVVPPTITAGVLGQGINKLRAIAVPAESIDLYKADPNWNALTNNFIPLEEFEYGNVKTLARTWTMGSGNSLAMYGVITGTADLADVGKTVTILYSDFRYNSNLGYNERSNIEELSAVVQPDGTFRVETSFIYSYATQFVTAYIGYGNEKIADY